MSLDIKSIEISHITEKSKNITNNKIYLLERESTFFHDYKCKTIIENFFIDLQISGALLETNTSNIYALKTHSSIYIIIIAHYNELIIHNYMYTLQNDVDTYKKYNTSNNLLYSYKNIENLQTQISTYKNQCRDFIANYNKNTDTYEYIQNYRYLIASYANIRTTLLGNAESLYDSSSSNNFLLLWINNLDLSSYARVETWITKEVQKYLYNSFQFSLKTEYRLSLSSSWMRAISTVIEYLLVPEKKQKIIIYGQIYFETLRILETYFDTTNVIYCDPKNWIEQLAQDILVHAPDIIFIDAVTIAFDQNIFTKTDYNSLITVLNKIDTKPNIVLDVSMKYIYLEDYCNETKIENNIIFVWSLWKYLYWWMDLWFWGFIWYPQKLHKFESMFPNFWVGITTNDAIKIPILSYHEHIRISSCINNTIKDIQNIWSSLNNDYSSILINFCNSWEGEKQTENFFWNLINIGYKNPQLSREFIYENKQEIVQIIMESAKKQGIDLSYSTSYWYYNTRVSLFMSKSIKLAPITHPCYIRISVWYTSQSSDIIKLMKMICILLTSLKDKKCPSSDS